ncbi:MAG: hypothetical protein ACFFCI_20480, partial [Promethearchaeota archaeon]
MKCERVLQILESIQNKIDIVTSYEEISELLQYNLVSEFRFKDSPGHIEHDLKGLKGEYIQLSSQIRDSYKNLVSMESEYNNLSSVKKFSSFFKIGFGSSLKSEIKELKQIIEEKENLVKDLKNQILLMSSQKETIERATKVNGMSVVLTPLGDNMIDEIKSRRRFYVRELHELVEVIQRLDAEFTKIINKVGNIMRINNFSAIWALYLINIDRVNLTNLMNTITMNEYNYNTAQERMMTLSFYSLQNPELRLTNSYRDASRLENELKYQNQRNNPKSQIHNLLDRTNYATYKAGRAISLLGNLFAIRANKNLNTLNEINKFLENLEILVDFHSNLPMIGKDTILYDHLRSYTDEEMVHVLLILALSTHLDSYNYFFKIMEDIPQGTKFFSAVCSLFPWDPEETWMVMLRAQSNILKAQSAKFIPELIEYSLLMTLNPQILTIENDISQEELKRWQTLTIPFIHLSIYSYLEKDLETYIRRRPLAYIIAPRYFIYSSLHYHTV